MGFLSCCFVFMSLSQVSPSMGSLSTYGPHCLWSTCQHPCCWEAERRNAKGIPSQNVHLPSRECISTRAGTGRPWYFMFAMDCIVAEIQKAATGMMYVVSDNPCHDSLYHVYQAYCRGSALCKLFRHIFFFNHYSCQIIFFNVFNLISVNLQTVELCTV